MDKFTLNTAFYEPIKGLSDKQLGRLFRAIFEYQICGSTEVDSDIAMAFGFFKSQFDLEGAKRMRIVERNRQNGQNGGRPKAGRKAEGEETQKPQWVIEKPKKPTGFSTPLSPFPLSPTPPNPIPPISPLTTTTTTPAHTHEEEFSSLESGETDDDGIGTQSPKEKSCAKKENTPYEPLPAGTYIPVDRLADTLLADKRWLNDVSTNKGHPIEKTRALVQEFCTNILLTENVKEIHDAKRHFIAWLRKRPQNNEQHTTQRPMRSYRTPEPDFEGIKAYVARGLASAKPAQ